MLTREAKQTTDKLNIRTVPEVKPETLIAVLAKDAEFTALKELTYNDGTRIWQYGASGLRTGWVVSEFLRPKS
jgi:hypothetical protein